MHAFEEFQNISPSIWSIIEAVSQCNCTLRSQDCIRSYTPDDVTKIVKTQALMATPDDVTQIVTYLNFRSEHLNQNVPRLLRRKAEAVADYEQFRTQHRPITMPLINRGNGEPLYLASLVAMMAEMYLGRDSVIIDPQVITICSDSRGIIATTCDRPDGVIPCSRNPKLQWETKEYMDSTNYGSRVNDGLRVAELNGQRFSVLAPDYRPKHFMFVDGYEALWRKGRPYCCRLFDLLHRNYVDEVVFGREVLQVWEPVLRELNFQLG